MWPKYFGLAIQYTLLHYMYILLRHLLPESTFKKLHIRNEVIEYLPTVLRIVARWWRVGFPDCAKRPVKDVSITAMDPRIGLELPQQTSQLRMAGDCVQPVSSGRVRVCPALCLVILNSPNVPGILPRTVWTDSLSRDDLRDCILALWLE